MELSAQAGCGYTKGGIKNVPAMAAEQYFEIYWSECRVLARRVA
jgi:hypothetical protein